MVSKLRIIWKQTVAADAADSMAETETMATTYGRGGGSYTAAHLPKYLARPGITDSEQAARERRWAVPRTTRCYN